TKLAWYSNTTNTSSRPIRIYLKTTTATTFTDSTWASQIAGATLVYDSSSTITTGWNEFNLTNSFNYTGGTNNLLVLVEANAGGSGISGSSGNIRYSAAADKHMNFNGDNNAPTGNGYISNARPNIQVTFTSLVPCSGTPTGGAVTVNPTSGNPGSTYGITATGYTTGTGLTYQWQYSDNAGSTWTDQGTATASYTALTGMIAPATLGVIRTWRLVVTCTAGGSTNSSTGTFTTALTPCTPTNTYSSSYYISGVTTTGGVANINNTPTDFSEYTDYTSIFVSQFPGSNFTITATHPSSTYGYNVWIDWNND